MYINFKILDKFSLTINDTMVLQYLSQLRIEKDLDQTLYENSVLYLQGLGYVDRLVDGSPRLSKKGREVLELIQIPDATENHVALAEYLLEKYKDDGDKILCSKKKLIELVAWFCSEASVSARELYEIIETYFQTEDSKYNKKLDYLFFRPENTYQRRSLNSSRLYTFYDNNREQFNFK